LSQKRALIVAPSLNMLPKSPLERHNIPTCLPLGHCVTISTFFRHLFPSTFSQNIFIGLTTHWAKRPHGV